MQLLRYQVLFLVQLIFLAYDLFVNAFVQYLGSVNVYVLVMYTWVSFPFSPSLFAPIKFEIRLQELLLISAAITICLEISSTFMFQAGLASLVLSKFRGTLVTLAVYFILCLALHIWGLVSLLQSLG